MTSFTKGTLILARSSLAWVKIFERCKNQLHEASAFFLCRYFLSPQFLLLVSSSVSRTRSGSACRQNRFARSSAIQIFPRLRGHAHALPDPTLANDTLWQHTNIRDFMGSVGAAEGQLRLALAR